MSSTLAEANKTLPPQDQQPPAAQPPEVTPPSTQDNQPPAKKSRARSTDHRDLDLGDLRDENDLSLDGMALSTKQKLAEEELVPCYCRHDPGEEKMKGARKEVTINGYRFSILKGRMVNVPRSVAKLVDDSQGDEERALNEHELNLDSANPQKRAALGLR